MEDYQTKRSKWTFQRLQSIIMAVSSSSFPTKEHPANAHLTTDWTAETKGWEERALSSTRQMLHSQTPRKPRKNYFTWIYVCPTVWLTDCLSDIYLSVWLTHWLSDTQGLSICATLCLSEWLTVCLSVWQSHSLTHSFILSLSRLVSQSILVNICGKHMSEIRDIRDIRCKDEI